LLESRLRSLLGEIVGRRGLFLYDSFRRFLLSPDGEAYV
jgi:hypothetical protein